MDKKEKITLKVEKRKVTGRKVKFLRREGILPANIYGKNVKSLAVQLGAKSFLPVFKQVGETGLVDLKIEGEKEARPVLIQNPQINPVTNNLIHLDFYQVDLSEKVTTDIPIELTGESPAVSKGEGVLVQLLSEIEVEALPTDLPEKFIVDVAKLEKVDQGITVEEMIKSSKINLDKVALKASEKQLVVKIKPPTPEEEVTPVEEAAPVEGEVGISKEGKPEEKKEVPQPEAPQPESPQSQNQT